MTHRSPNDASHHLTTSPPITHHPPPITLPRFHIPRHNSRGLQTFLAASNKQRSFRPSTDSTRRHLLPLPTLPRGPVNHHPSLPDDPPAVLPHLGHGQLQPPGPSCLCLPHSGNIRPLSSSEAPPMLAQRAFTVRCRPSARPLRSFPASSSLARFVCNLRPP